MSEQIVRRPLIAVDGATDESTDCGGVVVAHPPMVPRRGTIRGYYDALAPDAVTKLLADTNHLLREQPR